MSKYKLFIIALCITEALFRDPCKDKKNCRDCILDSNACVWCADDDFKDDLRRCKLESDVIKDWCSNPQRPNATKEHSNSEPVSDDVQIKPEKYKIKLLPGQTVNFDFTFNSMKNYPVDIYFVIDASGTMDVYKHNTAKQAKNIYDTLLTMTENVALGLGTFIDKSALPFNNNMKNLCYSFKHHLNLTSDYEAFQEMVNKYKTGYNFDLPEGGLDALAQAITCKHFLWRDRSAKIVVYMTDAPYHAAGDGRVAGIFEPYDGKCYTNVNDGVYTKELEMDYPSIGMINKLATEHDVIILFAIKVAGKNHASTETTGEEYDKLSNIIKGSEYLKLTDVPNEDLVNKLRGIYERISTKIKLSVQYKENARSNFKITFDPDCTKDIDACKVIKEKPQYFKASITLLEYKNIDNYNLDIAVDGVSDKLTLEIGVIKQCECESKSENSEYCNKETRQCGICICSKESKRYGVTCSCLSNSDSTSYNNNSCIDHLHSPSVLCNGVGECDCGQCKCRAGFNGEFCECDSKGCPHFKGALCNNKGSCHCGSCKCIDDYSGDACQCYHSEDNCRSANKKICSNRGKCDCGECKCDDIASWDKRISQNEFCTMNDCPECHNLQCTSITPCVSCLLKSNDSSCPCEGLKVEVVPTITEDMVHETGWNPCNNMKVDIGCYTKLFLYQYDAEEYRINVIMTQYKNCLESHYMYGGIFLVSLIVIGILTLIGWKLITEMNYRREYTKFVQQHREDLSGPSSNPLYETPTTTFRNPAFRQRSVN